jgi:superfamily I DNA/RNA helicase
LRDKIVSATGKDLKNVDYTTIGRTTHSIAIEMMNRFDPEAGSKSILDEFEQNDLLKRAIELAKKTPTSGAPDEESFFKEQISPIPEAQRKNNVRILSMLFNVERWMEGRGWSKGQSARLQAIRTQVANKEAVEKDDEKLVKKILTFSRGKKILNRAFGGDAKAIKKYIGDFSLQPSKKNRVASASNTEAWWGFVGGELSAPSAGKAKLFITKCKSRMISPTEAFAKVDGKGEKHVANAKIYGAYQYLLGEGERMDFDDVIIRGVQVLNYAQNLKEVQKQYKHIIVDEAQDLNPAQHAFFGLIAGTYTPNMRTKGAPTPVSNPSLSEGNSFTLIGDENQSIYGFRGASRSEFTDKVEEGFDLKSIGINFRSGESIVNAANMLVNAKKGEGLGLVCVASAKKSSDSITHDRKKDSSTAARDVAKHIKKMTGSEQTDDTPRSYGIACRTNAEIIPYALALLSEGVPFKSGVNPFQHKTTRAIVRLMGFLTSSGALQKSAVLNSWKDFGYSFPPVKYKRAVDAVLALNNDPYGDFPAVISNALSKKDMDTLSVFKEELEVEVDDLKKVIAFNHALAKWKESSNRNPATAFDTALGYAPVEGDTFFTGEDDKKLHEILSASGVEAEEIGSDTSASESGEDEAQAETAEVEDAEALALAPLSALRTMFATGTDFDAIFEKIEKMKLDASKNQGKADVDEDVVVLDTVHGWKGLEAEHMYVPMNAGKFPSDKVEIDPIVHDNEDDAKADKEAEERLLGYVAVTRGMKSVTLLSYEKDDKGEDMDQSEFIGQMGICEDAPSSRVASALSVLAELAGEPEDIELSDAELDEALDIF